MNQFTADIAAILEIAVGACTAYWWLKYYSHGHFDHPTSVQVNVLPQDDITHHYYREGTEGTVLKDANPGDMVHPTPGD